MGGVGVREPREELVSASDLVAVGESNEDPATRTDGLVSHLSVLRFLEAR
jgi:hypothetical protein